MSELDTLIHRTQIDFHQGNPDQVEKSRTPQAYGRSPSPNPSRMSSRNLYQDFAYPQLTLRCHCCFNRVSNGPLYFFYFWGGLLGVGVMLRNNLPIKRGPELRFNSVRVNIGRNIAISWILRNAKFIKASVELWDYSLAKANLVHPLQQSQA
jgi:hypothetical protein